MKQKAEEIYHRFVNYEWNDVGDGLQKSIIEAIETALKEGQKLPIHNVSVSLGYHEGYEKGWTDATSQAIAEINKNYKPNER